jgi:hypothetical protein
MAGPLTQFSWSDVNCQQNKLFYDTKKPQVHRYSSGRKLCKHSRPPSGIGQRIRRRVAGSMRVSAAGEEKKQQPPITFVIGGSVVQDVKPGPRLPLQPECRTVCRFSQYCLSFGRDRPARLSQPGVEWKAGPPSSLPFSTVSSASRSCSEQKRFLYQTVELLEPSVSKAMFVPIAKAISRPGLNQLLWSSLRSKA